MNLDFHVHGLLTKKCNFNEELFLQKQKLLLDLKNNVALLNEIATELNLETVEISQEALVGTTASTHFPLLFIISVLILFFYFYQLFLMLLLTWHFLFHKL